MHELNLKGLKFPLILKDAKKFERQIQTISVNILQWTENQPLPLQVTEYRDRPHHVKLLLLHGNKHLNLITLLYVTCPDLLLDELNLMIKFTYVLIVFTVLLIQT